MAGLKSLRQLHQRRYPRLEVHVGSMATSTDGTLCISLPLRVGHRVPELSTNMTLKSLPKVNR